MNQSQTHSAIIAQIHKWDFTKQFDDIENLLDERLIQWADYVVFPTVLSDIRYIIDAFQSLNPKISFVMDIDMNYHEIPESCPLRGKITDQHIAYLNRNLYFMDLVLCATEELTEFYTNYWEKNHPEVDVSFCHHANQVSSIGFQDFKVLKRNTYGKKVRIGIINPSSYYFDVLSIKEVLQEINKKYGSAVQIVLFGWNGEQRYKWLPDVNLAYEKAVPFARYYRRLNDLRFDLILLPQVKHPFNLRGKSSLKYLEASALGIPVIASDIPAYRNVIKDKVTGFLVSTFTQWMEVLEELIKSKSLRRKIGQNAMVELWKKKTEQLDKNKQKIGYSYNELFLKIEQKSN